MLGKTCYCVDVSVNDRQQALRWCIETCPGEFAMQDSGGNTVKFRFRHKKHADMFRMLWPSRFR